MCRCVAWGRWTVLLLAFAAGCSSRPSATQTKEEDQVRETFAAFQAALKGQDADKLWPLLDADSQADAERAAQAVRAAYTKAAPAEKAEQEKALGLTGAELAELTGRGFLKTRRFRGKYDEVPDSKTDKVTVQGDKATVAYTEPDGDKEKFGSVRQDGRWRLSVPMPRAAQP